MKSFIFGEPKKVSGDTIESLFNKIDTRIQPILKIINQIEYEITKDNNCLKLLKQLRDNNKELERQFEEEYEDISGELIDTIYSIKGKIRKTEIYKKAVNTAWNNYRSTLANYYENIALFEVRVLEVVSDTTKFGQLRDLKSYLIGFIEDFKTKNLTIYDYDAVELLYEYNFEDKVEQDKNSEEYKVYFSTANFLDIYSKELKNCTYEEMLKYEDEYREKQDKIREEMIDFNKAIFNTLGEFGIFRIPDGYLPTIILDVLNAEANLSRDSES